ncbi:MAG TPA: helix-turn-helix domain-containing protein [Gammaproteobacteria bacterium]|nr:helix-turn-helix domain-containing protein [Gammaproteobacteria bacterium]
MPAEHPETPRLLKMSEVASILRISRTSAYRLAASGELPSVRFGGGTVRVRAHDLARFIDDSRVGDGSRSSDDL